MDILTTPRFCGNWGEKMIDKNIHKKRDFHIYNPLPLSEVTGKSLIEVEGDSATVMRGHTIETTHKFDRFELANSHEEIRKKIKLTSVIYDTYLRKWFFNGFYGFVEIAP